jgi:hypothetical protein
MEIKVNIEDYLTEDEISNICKEELAYKIKDQLKYLQPSDILGNISYKIVFQKVEEIMQIKKEEMNKMIEDKVVNIIENFGVYEVFRSKDRGYGDKDSLATTYLKQSVENNKDLIGNRVKDLLGDFNVELFRQDLDDMIYECVQNKLFGKDK